MDETTSHQKLHDDKDPSQNRPLTLDERIGLLERRLDRYFNALLYGVDKVNAPSGEEHSPA